MKAWSICMKKRYGKFFAYLLFGSATGGVIYPLGAVALLITGDRISDQKTLLLMYLFLIAICWALTIFLTKKLNRRTPQGERLSTWFHAYWLGFRIAVKIALCFTLILLPKMMGMHLSVPEEDVYEPHWYDERGKVRDPNGNEYKVGRSGDYIKDSSGKWIRVHRYSNGDPYIEINSEKIPLE